MRGVEVTYAVHSDAVVAVHIHPRAKLSQILEEVVGKRVVVVDDDDVGAAHQSSCCAATSIARNIPAALRWVSSNSDWALLSATTPAPACTWQPP